MQPLSGPTDAELVARVLTADREAFAQVYDRYGPRLYDFAYSMLRHREDASDAVADSFVTFAEKLGQLRDPERLRPWLYAIVRSECLRRLKARKRVSYGDDEQLAAMPDDSLTPDQEAERAALTKLVWDAAAGLADRDRALLDLHLRQGLEGAELGEAMGVSAANAYVMLNRLRAQVDRSLGALLIARLGRDDCEELDALLVDWDGSFSPLIRKRVARHVESCETCGERRRRLVSPWMLLAGVPVFVAPLALRDRVVDNTQLVAFSGASSETARFSRARATAAAAVFVAAAGVTTVLAWPDSDPTDTSASPTVPAATTNGPTPTAPATSAAPDPTPTAAASTSAAPGDITVSASAVDLGLRATSRTVQLNHSGGSPVAFTVSSDELWLSVSPASGTLPVGESLALTIRADRSKVPEGRSTGTVTVTWAGGSDTVRVAVTEQNRPVVGRPGAVRAPDCGHPTVPVRVSVSDQSRLAVVRLLWTGPNGSGSARMTRSGSRWTAPMGPFDLGGTVTFHVVATDRFGNTASGPSGTVTATPCPG
ncbi:MAG: sigma-70 family RNA polymerase sigma factor [Marmoricola sp.]